MPPHQSEPQERGVAAIIEVDVPLEGVNAGDSPDVKLGAAEIALSDLMDHLPQAWVNGCAFSVRWEDEDDG